MGSAGLRILLDTHIWLWYLTDSSLIPKAILRTVKENLSDCRLSPVSIWEAVVLMEKKRFEVPVPPREWITKAFDRFPIQEAALTRESAIVSREIDLPHEDPADRFIAATALTFELRLATVDKRLLGAKGVPTLTLR